MTLTLLVVVVKAIQRLAATHSVEAMVRSSPAGRFLDSQVSAHMPPTVDDAATLLLHDISLQSVNCERLSASSLLPPRSLAS